MSSFKITKDGKFVAISKTVKQIKSEAPSVLDDAVNKALHTAWQAGGATFFAGVAGVKDFSTLEDLVLASVVAGLAAGGAFLKTYVKAYFASRKGKA